MASNVGRASQKLWDFSSKKAKLSVYPIVSHRLNYESISFVVNFGPCHETKQYSGISHLIRLSAHLSTRNDSKFGLQKFFQPNNIRFDVEQQKDFTAYHICSPPDLIIEACVKLGEILSKPMFFYHEIRDLLNHEMPDDDTRMNFKNPETRLHDMIHRACFGFKGFGNSSFYQSNDSLHSEDLENFYINDYMNRSSFAICSSSHSTLISDLPLIFEKFKTHDKNLNPSRQIEQQEIRYFILNFSSQLYYDANCDKFMFLRQAGCEYYIDETVNFIKFAHIFVFDHNDQSCKERLKSFIGIRMASEIFRANYQEHGLRTSIFERYIINETSVSHHEFQVEPLLFEYESHTLFSIKFSVLNKLKVKTLIHAAHKFFANITEIVFGHTDNKIINSNRITDLLKRKMKLAYYSNFETNIEATQNNIRPLLLFGQFGLNIDDHLEEIDQEYILDHIVSKLSNKIPCFVALGDCKFLDNCIG